MNFFRGMIKRVIKKGKRGVYRLFFCLVGSRLISLRHVCRNYFLLEQQLLPVSLENLFDNFRATLARPPTKIPSFFRRLSADNISSDNGNCPNL
jgi:hypothetical protein